MCIVNQDLFWTFVACEYRNHLAPWVLQKIQQLTFSRELLLQSSPSEMFVGVLLRQFYFFFTKTN